MPTPRPVRLCDYRGYACRCDGYHAARPGSSLCVCGHARSQHNTTGTPEELPPLPDLLQVEPPEENL